MRGLTFGFHAVCRRRAKPMILTAFRRGSADRTIGALYGMIVAQARSAVFYSGYGVPDTVQGRFDLLALHVVLVLRRLDHNKVGAVRSRFVNGRTLGQGIFDAFCRDLDGNLREMGVGDLAVPKEMRRFGEAFYGRQAAYRAAFAATDERELEKALARNIFDSAVADERAVRLARYVRAAAKQLDAEEEGALTAGSMVFPNPEAFADARA
jgi:cytochrome b pre-mRNA-processing protein 3